VLAGFVQSKASFAERIWPPQPKIENKKPSNHNLADTTKFEEFPR
jgi:hypothetical protein